MKFNQSDKIDNDGGDWVVLNDYGSEGFTVDGQYKTSEEAISSFSSSACAPQILLKLPSFSVEYYEDIP